MGLCCNRKIKILYTSFCDWYNENNRQTMSMKAGEYMTEKEMLQKNIEEFSRLQTYMLLAEKNSETYKAMKIRYIELKIILTSSGVNLTEIDRIKE